MVSVGTLGVSAVDVSVIIVNWNTRELLRRCIESVLAQSAPLETEVIVVDNDSQDGSAEMVRQSFPGVTLIANGRNRGFAAANNQGIELATGKYILLLNSDTIVLNNAIARAVRLMPDDAAALGVRVLNPDGTLQPTCFMYPSALNMLLSSTYLYKLFPRVRFFGRERMTWWDRDDNRQVDVVTGCFLLARREAVDAIGPMDERFFMYAEETDWCYRFGKAGWKVMFTPGAEIIHYGGASTRRAASDMWLQQRGSTLLFIKKHRSRPTYWLCCGLTAAFFILRIPYWAASAILSRADRSHCLEMLRTCVTGGFRCLGGATKLCVRREPC
jgi:GT2 family glycosyltransferase